MKGKITNFLREYVLFFSIILTVIGIILLFIGITGMFFEDIPRDLMGLNSDFLKWSIYILGLGFVSFLVGVYYLYLYLKNRGFMLKELKTNKRSELLKRHNELKITAKHMPSKYQKMLKEKEEELHLK